MSLFNQGATFGGEGKIYRYTLWREWDEYLPRALFIMLNPSTADAEKDDPTIRRCVDFATRWKYGSMEVVNLFALRATDPMELSKAADPVGPKNDSYIRGAAHRAGLIIAAWGTKGSYQKRDRRAEQIIYPNTICCLGQTKDGHPRHPLYLPKTAFYSTYMTADVE